MTEKSDPPPPIPLVENLFAAEVYADVAAVFSTKSGNVFITFASMQFDNTTQPAVAKNVVIGRLTMPLEGAQNLAVGLFDFLKQRGLMPAPSGPKN